VTETLGVWLALLKFRYHVTFLSVVCGALLFTSRIDFALAVQLLSLYGCFNVLLYGGIYTLNDVADRQADGKHPGKRHRPVASGRVSVRAAATVGALLVAAGLILGSVLFEPDVVGCFVAVLAFNVVYSFGGRGVRYLDVLFNSLTHPTRFLMGVLLVDRIPPATHVATLLLFAVAVSCLRRQVERDMPGWEARTTLARYAPCELSYLAAGCLMAVAALTLMFANRAPGFYSIIIATALVVAGGGWLRCPVRTALRTIWTY
jgi:decaprenyl-phosphate phosphoribosyltransferase